MVWPKSSSLTRRCPVYFQLRLDSGKEEEFLNGRKCSSELPDLGGLDLETRKVERP